jgi:hypothetical protein
MMRAGMFGVAAMMACSSAPQPIAHRSTSPAAAPAPARVYERLSVHGHAMRTTWILKVENDRVTLDSTTLTTDVDYDIRAAAEPPWRELERETHQGTIRPATKLDPGGEQPGRMKIEVEGKYGAITMFCVETQLDVAPAGAFPMPGPPCPSGTTTWYPGGLERVPAFLCEDIGQVGSGSTNGRWVFGAPGIQFVEHHDDTCGESSALRGVAPTRT